MLKRKRIDNEDGVESNTANLNTIEPLDGTDLTIDANTILPSGKILKTDTVQSVGTNLTLEGTGPGGQVLIGNNQPLVATQFVGNGLIALSADPYPISQDGSKVFTIGNSNQTDATSSITGAVQVQGGLATTKGIFANTSVTTPSVVTDSVTAKTANGSLALAGNGTGGVTANSTMTFPSTAATAKTIMYWGTGASEGTSKINTLNTVGNNVTVMNVVTDGSNNKLQYGGGATHFGATSHEFYAATTSASTGSKIAFFGLGCVFIGKKRTEMSEMKILAVPECSIRRK